MQKDAKNLASAPNDRGSTFTKTGQRDGRRNRLRKAHILRGYSSFTRVLSVGRSLSIPPVRLFFRTPSDNPTGFAIGFAVSRSFRSAAKRNKARRLMREAYRCHQDIWEKGLPDNGIEAVWMYVGKPQESPRFDRVEKAIQELMKKVSAKTL